VEQLARREGIMVSRVEVDERVNLLMRAQSMDPDSFWNRLSREGISQETFREQLRKQLVMQKLFSRNPVSATITVTDAEIEALHRRVAPEEFHIMHLYVSLPPGASFAQRAEREQKISNVETALAQNPWNFARVAAANADIWRDWGFVLPSPDLPAYLFPAFSRLQRNGQVFSFRVVNEIPGFPGFHALMLVNKRRVALDAVRDRLEAMIREEKLNESIEAWLTTLRRDASIVHMP
jgi:parvulin-like peptidyl-prolyl isomerase